MEGEFLNAREGSLSGTWPDPQLDTFRARHHEAQETAAPREQRVQRSHGAGGFQPA